MSAIQEIINRAKDAKPLGGGRSFITEKKQAEEAAAKALREKPVEDKPKETPIGG